MLRQGRDGRVTVLRSVFVACCKSKMKQPGKRSEKKKLTSYLELKKSQ